MCCAHENLAHRGRSRCMCRCVYAAPERFDIDSRHDTLLLRGSQSPFGSRGDLGSLPCLSVSYLIFPFSPHLVSFMFCLLCFLCSVFSFMFYVFSISLFSVSIVVSILVILFIFSPPLLNVDMFPIYFIVSVFWFSVIYGPFSSLFYVLLLPHIPMLVHLTCAVLIAYLLSFLHSSFSCLIITWPVLFSLSSFRVRPLSVLPSLSSFRFVFLFSVIRSLL